MLGHLQVCSPFDSEKNQIANYSCELQLRMQLKMCIIAIFKNIFVCDLIEVVNKVRLGQHRLVIKNHVCCIQWIAQKMFATSVNLRVYIQLELVDLT